MSPRPLTRSAAAPIEFLHIDTPPSSKPRSEVKKAMKKRNKVPHFCPICRSDYRTRGCDRCGEEACEICSEVCSTCSAAVCARCSRRRIGCPTWPCPMRWCHGCSVSLLVRGARSGCAHRKDCIEKWRRASRAMCASAMAGLGCDPRFDQGMATAIFQRTFARLGGFLLIRKYFTYFDCSPAPATLCKCQNLPRGTRQR